MDSPAAGSARAGPAKMRDDYEAMPGQNDGKPVAGTGYMFLGPAEHQRPTEHKLDERDEASERDRRKKKEERKKKKMEEERQKVLLRRLTVGCTIFVIALVIVGLMSIAVYLITLPKGRSRRTQEIIWQPKGSRNATYDHLACFNAFPGAKNTSSRCIMVMLPAPRSDLKCGNLMCTYNLFSPFDKSSTKNFRALKPADVSSTVHIKSNKSTFCRVQRTKTSAISSGVCVNGRCEYRYYPDQNMPKPYLVDTTFGSSVEKGKWVDNCDRAHSCWDAKGEDLATFDAIRHDPVFLRRFCNDNDTTLQCPTDEITSALVYLQHRECQVNGDRVGDFCPYVSDDGHLLMFELFVCKNCTDNIEWVSSSEGIAKQHEKFCPSKDYAGYANTDQSNCSVVCRKSNNDTEEIMLPNGARCQLGDADVNEVIGFCVQGACFHWHGLGPEAIMEIDRCKREKIDRDGVKPKFDWV